MRSMLQNNPEEAVESLLGGDIPSNVLSLTYNQQLDIVDNKFKSLSYAKLEALYTLFKKASAEERKKIDQWFRQKLGVNFRIVNEKLERILWSSQTQASARSEKYQKYLARTNPFAELKEQHSDSVKMLGRSQEITQTFINLLKERLVRDGGERKSFATFVQAEEALHKLAEALVDYEIPLEGLGFLLDKDELSKEEEQQLDILINKSKENRQERIAEKFKGLVAEAVKTLDFSEEAIKAAEKWPQFISELLAGKIYGRTLSLEERLYLPRVQRTFALVSRSEKLVKTKLKYEMEAGKKADAPLLDNKEQIKKDFARTLTAYLEHPNLRKEKALLKAAVLLNRVALAMEVQPIYEGRLQLLAKEMMTKEELKECHKAVRPERAASKSCDFFEHRDTLLQEALADRTELLESDVKKLKKLQQSSMKWSNMYRSPRAFFEKLLNLFINTKQKAHDLTALVFTLESVMTHLEEKKAKTFQNSHTLFAGNGAPAPQPVADAVDAAVVGGSPQPHRNSA